MNAVADFNIHLPPDGDFKSEMDFNRFDPLASWNAISGRLKQNGIGWCNVMMLDSTLMRAPRRDLVTPITEEGHAVTVGIDPRFSDAADLVDRAADIGVRGIKFHAYFLDLEDRDFDKAVLVAQRAAARGLWVCVCCSYGTRNVYRISGIRLLLTLVQARIETPLIALHAGGRHVLDVMLAACDAPNVMLELSFSIPYWLGSSVEQDFQFAIRKLGASRFLYASDHPHQPLDANIATMRNWLTAIGICAADQELIFNGNARRLVAELRA